MKLSTKGRYAVTAMLDLALHADTGPVSLADISERQRAMLDFALKVSRQAETVNESDYEKLNALGFDDEDIWDIGAISAFFGLSNRIVNLSSMRTNDEFYLMGRVPREK